MARSPLFFRPYWLGTFERAAKSTYSGERAVANQPHCALSTRKAPALVDSDPPKFGDGTFRRRPNFVRYARSGRGALFQRTCALQRPTAFSSRRSVVAA